MRITLLIVLFAAPLWAAPPSVSVMRMTDLEAKLAALYGKLRKAEELAAKPRHERMIIRFRQGALMFEGKKFTDKGFVQEILIKWQAVQTSIALCDPNHVGVLALLPDALRARYDATPIPKAKRYQASKVLVKVLKSKHDIIRKTAIDSLERIYGPRLFYRFDASPAQRAARYRKWVKEIDRLRR